MQKLTHQEIEDRQAQKIKAKRIPLTVVLNDIRSLYNVGSIFRTSDGAGVEQIWLCGITGFPPNNQISKTALGAEDFVPWQYSKDLKDVVLDLKSRNYQILILEQAKNSIMYQDFRPSSPICLIVGNEINGISEDILDLCDAAIEIDMMGMKNSLNVSVAFGIVAYDIKNKLLKID